jgi:hypothetical protein
MTQPTLKSVFNAAQMEQIEAFINDKILLIFSQLPIYANNAAAKAGGLVDGQYYRTSTGAIMVVYT